MANGEKIASVETEIDGYQVRFLDKNFNIGKRLTLFPHPTSKKGQAFQRARLLDLGNFFKNYKGE